MQIPENIWPGTYIGQKIVKKNPAFFSEWAGFCSAGKSRPLIFFAL